MVKQQIENKENCLNFLPKNIMPTCPYFRVLYRTVFDVIEKKISLNTTALKGLITMALSLNCGNCLLERVFNATKKSLMIEKVLMWQVSKGKQLYKELFNINGKTNKVTIGYITLNTVKIAHMVHIKAWKRVKMANSTSRVESRSKIKSTSKGESMSKFKRHIQGHKETKQELA